MQGELTDHKGFPTDIPYGQVHLACLIRKNTKPGELATEPVNVFLGILGGNAQEDK
jgi:hypothetical protein